MKLTFSRSPIFLLGSVFFTVFSLFSAQAMSDRPSHEETPKPPLLTHISFTDDCHEFLAISYRLPGPNDFDITIYKGQPTQSTIALNPPISLAPFMGTYIDCSFTQPGEVLPLAVRVPQDLAKGTYTLKIGNLSGFPYKGPGEAPEVTVVKNP